MKGKQAARSAHRADQAHQTEIQALRTTYEARIEAQKERERDLKARLDQLSGQLEKSVRAIADERVRAAEEQGEQRLEAERARHRARVIELGNLLADHWVGPDGPNGLSGVLRIFGVSYVEMFPEREAANRRVRRASASWANQVKQMREDPRGIGA